MEHLTFDKIVVGGSLTALLYAYKHNLPIIIDQAHMPFQLDDCPKHWDFSFIGFSSKLIHKKSQIWDRLVFLLSMAGMVIFPNNMRNFRQEEGVLTIIMNNNKKFEVFYNDIIEFDRDRDETMIVYDWFAVRSGATHEYDVLADPNSDFCHTLLFHPSTRKSTRKEIKDVCSISTLPEKELHLAYHSETYSRLKTIQMMKDAGIRGQSNGYNKYGKQLHYCKAPYRRLHSRPCLGI